MRVSEAAFRWIWRNDAHYLRGLWLLGALATAQSVAAARGSTVGTLIEVLIVAVLAYLAAMVQCGLTVALTDGARARGLAGCVVVGGPLGAIAYLALHADPGLTRPATNAGAVAMVAAAAATRGVWRALERDNPSVSLPDTSSTTLGTG